MGVLKELYCTLLEIRVFFPTPALPESGSKGIISAASGTPFFSGAKVEKMLFVARRGERKVKIS